MIFHELIIIGGGASGLIAAIKAKDLGIDVCILEATDRVGKKILTTGNGRCNIGNNTISYPFTNFHSNNSGFFIDTLNKYGINEIKDFFLFLGLPLTELKNGKLYPQSLQASSVVDILRMNIEERAIPIYTNTKVKTINKTKTFLLKTSNEEFKEFKCNKVLVATGGKSAPKTGSDGSSYWTLEQLGHSTTPTLPGIVQLKLDYPNLKAISGVKFDGFATVIIDKEKVRTEFGEILFTDYGISGPPILQISSHASIALHDNKKVNILIDMLPSYTKENLIDFFEGHFAIFNHRSVHDSLIGIIHKKLIPTILKESGICDIHMPCYELEWNQKQKLINNLKEWNFNCIDTNGFNSAQVTVGGIDTTDINPTTLESKIVPGLYFSGEIMDVHGDCGGFNLTWAWSSALSVIDNIK